MFCDDVETTVAAVSDEADDHRGQTYGERQASSELMCPASTHECRVETPRVLRIAHHLTVHPIRLREGLSVLPTALVAMPAVLVAGRWRSLTRTRGSSPMLQ